MITTRTMVEADAPFGLELCRLVGWNQLAGDWRRLLVLDPQGVFIAEDDGRPCGTGSTVSYGGATAWIGMILVHPDFRRRGIGSTLMARCIEHLRDKHIAAIKLDATDEGRPVYLKLGFKDERPIQRYCLNRQDPGGASRPAAGAASLPLVTAADLGAMAALDLKAFGANRAGLLKSFLGDGFSAIVTGPGGRACGFARRGRQASYLGPLVAENPLVAQQVASSLLAQLPAGQVYWDVLPDNAAARQLAESCGFTVARRLTRMYLGDTMNPGEVGLVYGVAGFELG
jgi:GNAT superfamily N-acetyltransferase